jgi:5-methylcytosine-specific restriction endonuclease McrA
MKKPFRLVLPEKQMKLLRESVYVRDGYKCRSCGYRNHLAAHHIQFRSQGGDDVSGNLITLCSTFGSPCHEAVHRGDLQIQNRANILADVDADKSVKFVRCNGWVPTH